MPFEVVANLRMKARMATTTIGVEYRDFILFFILRAAMSLYCDGISETDHYQWSYFICDGREVCWVNNQRKNVNIFGEKQVGFASNHWKVVVIFVRNWLNRDRSIPSVARLTSYKMKSYEKWTGSDLIREKHDWSFNGLNPVWTTYEMFALVRK